MKRTLRAGPFVFRDPVLLCGVLYGLLWFDASGFLRIGLWAAFLHECGHVAAYLAMLHEMPSIESHFSFTLVTSFAAKKLSSFFGMLTVTSVS